MGIPIGTSLYGHVDYIDGLGSVATKFFHIAYLPLIPVGTYFVLEDSDDGYGFKGASIASSPLSILIGYLHGWLLVPAYMGLVFGLFAGLGGRWGICMSLTMAALGGLMGAIPYFAVSIGSMFVLKASEQRTAELHALIVGESGWTEESDDPDWA